MSEYKARRSFYSGGRLINRGQTVDGITDAEHLRQLVQLQIISPVVETKVFQPEIKEQLPPKAAVIEAEPAAINDAAAEGTESPQEQPQDLAALSYSELKELAKAAGIKGYNTMKKNELIKNLEGDI